ncbi:hypothetical protein MIR68_003470 [Amoeboaphelidium protococcarum]|nr:hypothetical protein MIR68_004414 [Amoeboaphelidium protococcarum]KAI3638972.1 hypothetical protein MIR68_003470 [Amoeboaphelidium protococcarum]KAI3650664.1 hypothetical protein MP228_004145 [Amoeboaphelidium protococcarum]KAI3654701.1 hypothetical protein MP228_000081 [Amoeboaphelidium protococcarum]
MDLSGLSEGERMKMLGYIEQKQVKDSMKMVGSLVDMCFRDCINDFTSTALTSKEDSCIQKCAEKFFKYSMRMNIRFQDENQKIMNGQMQ